MDDYLSIPNWEEFQHYKDRNPPWIKLHNQLLENYKFECLQDASKAHLLCLWLLASRTDNKINPDPGWIARKIGANSEVDIKALIDAGFLQLNQTLRGMEHDASNVQQTQEQDAIPEERERREEKSREKENVLEIFSFWCDVMKKGKNVKLSDKRKSLIISRLNDGYSAQDIKTAIENCSKSPHNMGQNDRQTLFNDIELICRNSEKLEYFRDSVGAGKAKSKPQIEHRSLHEIVGAEAETESIEVNDYEIS